MAIPASTIIRQAAIVARLELEADLRNALANDEFEVAQPVLLRSALLSDEELISIFTEAQKPMGARQSTNFPEQLWRAVHTWNMTEEQKMGVVVYLRGHEGRGIGLVEKLRAYELQDAGLDTVDANLRLGHDADQRTYGQTAAMLEDLGIREIRLLSSNPAKQEALTELGVRVVSRQSLIVPRRPENAAYLRTKRERMGHLLEGLDDVL